MATNTSDLVTNIQNNLAVVPIITKPDIKKVVQTTFAEIEKLVRAGEEVSIPQFGRFSLRHYPERTGRNPMTGESIQVAAKTKMVFKPVKRAKVAVE